MYCINCGSQLKDGTVICPVCSTQIAPSMGKAAGTENVPPAEPVNVREVKNERPENPKAKGFAAIASALLAFPTLVCLVVDYLGAPTWVHWIFNLFNVQVDQIQPGNMDWSLYLVGVVMCLWMAIVLPAMRPKRPAVTVCICLAVISAYMLLLAYINSSATWYVEWILPIFLMITVSSAIMSILISYKVIKGNHVFSAIGIQAALISIGLEIVGDMNIHGAVNLRWSLIFAVILIGVIMVYEAVSYASRVNKK